MTTATAIAMKTTTFFAWGRKRGTETPEHPQETSSEESSQSVNHRCAPCTGASLCSSSFLPFFSFTSARWLASLTRQQGSIVDYYRAFSKSLLPFILPREASCQDQTLTPLCTLGRNFPSNSSHKLHNLRQQNKASVTLHPKRV